jgi:hypothetical protein
VNLTDVVRSAVAAAHAQAAEHGVRLAGPNEAEPPHHVEGSRAALHRAVTALLDNATRHASGEVAVGVVVQGAEVLVDVADDGPGVDPERRKATPDRRNTAIPGRRGGRYRVTEADANTGAEVGHGSATADDRSAREQQPSLARAIGFVVTIVAATPRAAFPHSRGLG